MLLILGFLSIAVGAAYLFGKRAVWPMTARRYRVVGLAPVRTPAWDADANRQGVLMVVVGLVLLFFGFAAYPDAPPRTPQPPRTGYNSRHDTPGFTQHADAREGNVRPR